MKKQKLALVLVSLIAWSGAAGADDSISNSDSLNRKGSGTETSVSVTPGIDTAYGFPVVDVNASIGSFKNDEIMGGFAGEGLGQYVTLDGLIDPSHSGLASIPKAQLSLKSRDSGKFLWALDDKMEESLNLDRNLALKREGRAEAMADMEFGADDGYKGGTPSAIGMGGLVMSGGYERLTKDVKGNPNSVFVQTGPTARFIGCIVGYEEYEYNNDAASRAFIGSQKRRPESGSRWCGYVKAMLQGGFNYPHYVQAEGDLEAGLYYDYRVSKARRKWINDIAVGPTIKGDAAAEPAVGMAVEGFAGVDLTIH